MYIFTFIVQCVKIIVKNSSNYLRLQPLNILKHAVPISMHIAIKLILFKCLFKAKNALVCENSQEQDIKTYKRFEIAKKKKRKI